MKIKSTLESYLFIAPAVLIFAVFFLIPFIYIFRLGFYEWDGIMSLKDAVFVGFANFKEMLFHDPSWWQAIRNAGWITLIALTFQNVLAFLLAWACDREIRMKNFYRVVFFIPPVLSEMVVGLVWRFIINDVDGANMINRLLVQMNLSQFVHSWLSDPKYALNTVAIVHSWKGFGWGFLIFLAGLQTIPRELYEAAHVDGAHAGHTFKNITLPLMMPVIILVAVLTVLGTMQTFVLIIGLVGGEFAGHTSVPVLRILAVMRDSSRFGYACAQGISFGAILIVISFIQYRFLKERQPKKI